MSDSESTEPSPVHPTGRRRRAAGERRMAVLQALASMLEAPQCERITTAALASRLQLSEAALYRHFASKAQMYDALIEFIEQSVAQLAQQVLDQELTPPGAQVCKLVGAWLRFGEHNPGLCRLLCAEVLVGESPRLQERVGRCLDRMEAILRQPYRTWAQNQGEPAPTLVAQGHASLAMSLLLGRWQRYSRSQFKRLPTEYEEVLMVALLAGGAHV